MSLLANQIDSRMEMVQSPLIPVISELIRNNPGTISLGQGVVNYPPPPSAVEAIQDFWQQPNNHKYQAVGGIPDLITALEKKIAQENKISITKDNYIVVTAGSNMAFMNAILAITNAGDEIILNTPYYFNHEMAITMASCHPVLVATDKNYQLQTDKIIAAITPRTKAIVTISPNNPTGAVYSPDALATVNQICREHNIFHISDEAYEYFVYDDRQHISPASLPNSIAHTISLFSLSKAYGFASWRIGYMVIPQHLIMPVKKVQDTNLICPPVISQYAALGAIKSGRRYCKNHIKDIIKVRNLITKKLKSVSDICTVNIPQGAFYCFLKIKTDLDDFTLAKRLIEEHQVAVIPGSTFGMDDGCYLRISYGALSWETATLGIDRLITGLHTIL